MRWRPERNPWLVLIRPANLVTSAADALAGIALAGVFWSPSPSHLLLVAASVCLYAGGVVFNDVCDAKLDEIERPERPIPRRQVTLGGAAAYGLGWLLAGIVLASLVSATSGLLALGIAALALTYDRWAKHHVVAGPLVMGSCRGLNLLLGLSIVPAALASTAYVFFLPLLFVAAITLTSQGEVHGGNRGALRVAMGLDAAIGVGFLVLAANGVVDLLTASPFLVGWGFANAQAKLAAYRDNRPAKIQAAVRTGVLSLIPLDSAYAAGTAGGLAGVLVLALLPVSVRLAAAFRVT